jgi:adenylate cyclase
MFDAVTDALLCAAQIQRSLETHNADIPDEQKVQFRIGVNLGDVIEDRGDIYGDGVNVAARLEGLAEPGGICISGTVYDAVGTRLPLDYESLGEQQVKNIEQPVRVYTARVRAGAELPTPAVVSKPPKARRTSLVAVAAALVLTAASGLLAWLQPWAPDVEPASVESMAFPLPEKPSVAVLPFDNMTGDPGQDFFVDAMTEGVITMLAKVPQLFVIARNSTFTYKGKPVEVRQVAEELGVRYVLEGSVQRSEDRTRVHAQLIDALSGHHLWAERFDTETADILAVQDELAQKVVTGLEVTLTEGEQRRLRRAETHSSEAWETYVRARQTFLRYTKSDNEQARQLYLEALELDPQYASALTQMAWTHVIPVWRGWSENPAQDLKRAREYAAQALAIDDTLPDGHVMMATLAITNNQYDEAVALGEKAASLSPSHAGVTAMLAQYLTAAGRHAEAVETIERAIRLAPYYPNWFLDIAGFAYQLQGNHDKAITAFEGKRDRLPNDPRSYVTLASAYAEAGHQEAARAAAREVLDRNPKFSIAAHAKRQKFKNPEDLERILDGLRKAGLPE